MQSLMALEVLRSFPFPLSFSSILHSIAGMESVQTQGVMSKGTPLHEVSLDALKRRDYLFWVMPSPCRLHGESVCAPQMGHSMVAP